MRSIHFDPDAWEDFLYWLAADRKMAVRIMRLIGKIQRDPFAGIGKPEPLKGDLSGYWSRRSDALGPVDVLVSSAGLSRVQPLEDVTAAQFDEMLAVNLCAPFLLAQRTVPAIRPIGDTRWFGRVRTRR